MPALSCATCGAPIAPHVGRGRPRKYCKTCTLKAPRLAGRDSHRKLGPRVFQATCKSCAMQFEFLSKEQGRRRKFCSKKCRIEHQRAIRHTYPNQIYQRRYYLKHGMQNRKRFQKTCLICEKPFETPNSKTVTCSIVCGGKLTVKRAIDKGTHIPIAVRIYQDDNERWRQSCHARRARIAGSQRIKSIEIYERDAWLCGICGGPVDASRKQPDPLSASIDHIVPIIRGGEHSRLNVQCAHLGCNSRKGAREGITRRKADTPAPIAGSGS